VPSLHRSFVSEVVKVVDARFTAHAARKPAAGLSAYRPNHSTETAVICFLNDLMSAIDQGHIGALMPHSIPSTIKFSQMFCDDGSELPEVHLIG